MMRTHRPGRLALAWSVAPAVALAVTSAHAQPRLGTPGQVAITAEDLTGYHAEQRVYKNADHLKITDDTNRFSLLFRSGGIKLGVHYFVIPSLSVGAALGYELRTGSTTVPDAGGTYTSDKGNEWTLLFQPKVGYALMVTDAFGFWFRGGPGYMHVSTHPDAWDKSHEVRETYWLFGLDALLAILPVPHFGLCFGPTADFSFAGSHGEYNGTDQAGNRVTYDHQASYRRLGVTFGLIGAF
jgi:hypothetical protein